MLTGCTTLISRHIVCLNMNLQSNMHYKIKYYGILSIPKYKSLDTKYLNQASLLILLSEIILKDMRRGINLLLILALALFFVLIYGLSISVD